MFDIDILASFFSDNSNSDSKNLKYISASV